MHGTSEFQVAAQTDGKIAELAFQGTDGQKVGKGLRGVLVPAVPGVYNRNGRFTGGNHGSAFFRMTHGADIGEAGDNPNGIRYAFAL